MQEQCDYSRFVWGSQVLYQIALDLPVMLPYSYYFKYGGKLHNYMKTLPQQ